MPFNIFEGARRLALLAGGLTTAIVVTLWYNSQTYVSVNYASRQPNLPFYRTDGDLCPTEGTNHYMTVANSKGDPVRIHLCLMPMKFKDGLQLIPYKIDATGMVWGATTYSKEVDEYRKTLEKTFMIPAEHQAEIAELVSKKKRKDWTDNFGGLVIGLGIFAALVSLIGWIVRGFMGIPNGMDHRP